MSDFYEDLNRHENLHLLALERTGWRRWVFGRWVYSSEPFRRDIQRKLEAAGFQGVRDSHTQFYPGGMQR